MGNESTLVGTLSAMVEDLEQRATQAEAKVAALAEMLAKLAALTEALADYFDVKDRYTERWSQNANSVGARFVVGQLDIAEQRLRAALAPVRREKQMPNQQTGWLPERAPYRLGDTVWLVKDVFEIGLDTPGIVIKTDIPVARAFEIGMDSCGIVEVEFAAVHRRVQSHWTNFTANAPVCSPNEET